MNRFHFIKKKISDDTLISMEEFWNSIKYKSNSLDQNRFSPFKEKLDFFYICLLIGLKTENKIDHEQFELSQINDTWTQGLKNKSKAREFILGLFLSVLIKDYKNDKSEIQKIINFNLDSNSDNKLSESGMKTMHKYCFGGYCKLLKELDNKTPSTIVAFISKINYLLN